MSECPLTKSMYFPHRFVIIICFLLFRFHETIVVTKIFVEGDN